MDGMRRREFVAAGAAAAGALTFGGTFWRRAFDAQAATAGVGPYGPLQPADANGLALPQGFSSRVIARGNVPVAGYPWHIFSDGQATYATEDGGWILVSNSEVPAPDGGGASAIRFNSDASIASAYRILGGTQTNCAGGRTPWGTWLSCEEYDGGQVWECDPRGEDDAVVRPALGVFNHESVSVDPVRKQLYLTEDKPDGGFYRFTPANYPDLRAGVLELATGSGADITWVRVPDPSAIDVPTRQQLPAMRKFNGGEGSWYDSGTVYFTTKGDHHVWAYNTETEQIEVLYAADQTPGGALRGVDNVTVTSSGDLYVCEDGDNLEICLITPEREVAPFLRVEGEGHSTPFPGVASELCGVIFDPSGTRMYFSSQRAFGAGMIFEVSGPFRLDDRHTGAPSAGGVPDGGDPPGIRLTMRRRVAYRRLLARGGLRIRVKISQPGVVALSLTAVDESSRPDKKGQFERAKTIKVGRFKRRFKRRGARNVRVKLNRRRFRRLRGQGSTVVRVTAQVTAPNGNVSVTNRRLRVFL
jgi:secreted PhoX family phosphatase